MSASESSHYEKTSLRGRPFIIGVIIIFLVMTIIFVVVWNLLQDWSRQLWPPSGPFRPPSAEARWNTKVPQLQINPALDLEEVRQMEDRRLHALRWNDAAHAYATIPIEDAIKLLVNAAAKNQLTTVLPAAQPATPIQLQDQKSRETSPLRVPNP